MSASAAQRQTRGPGGHKKKVSSAASRAKTMEDKLMMKPSLLRPEVNFPAPTNQGTDYDVANTYVGHWTRGSDADERMKAQRELLKAGNQQNGVTPWGVVNVDPNTAIDWLKEKKNQQEYLLEAQLGTFLVDPKRPETQDKAFSMFPELKEYPDAHFHNTLAMQEALRTMLRDGVVGSKEDHAMILEMVREDYALPVFPAWDPEGQILGHTLATSSTVDSLLGMQALGLFNPRRHGVDSSRMSTAAKNFNRRLKVMILKRLYPGLRDKNDEGENSRLFNLFIKRQTFATDPDAIGALDNRLFSQTFTGGETFNSIMRPGTTRFVD